MTHHLPYLQQDKDHEYTMSGHCHRVELMLSFLAIPYQTIDLDMVNDQHKLPEYLIINHFGQVPAIDDNGITLSDSDAILIYLAKKHHNGYQWLPTDPVQEAEVQRWLSVAAGENISLADVAAYSYISHVPEADVSLDPYPVIKAWLISIEYSPGFVAMARSPIPTK